jgi:hypothetical protein
MQLTWFIEIKSQACAWPNVLWEQVFLCVFKFDSDYVETNLGELDTYVELSNNTWVRDFVGQTFWKAES